MIQLVENLLCVAGESQIGDTRSQNKAPGLENPFGCYCSASVWISAHVLPPGLLVKHKAWPRLGSQPGPDSIPGLLLLLLVELRSSSDCSIKARRQVKMVQASFSLHLKKCGHTILAIVWWFLQYDNIS